jgi:hypothetical protein
MKVSRFRRRLARFHRAFGKPVGIVEVRDQIAYQAFWTSRFSAAVSLLAVVLSAVVASVAISSLWLNSITAQQVRRSGRSQVEANQKLAQAAGRQAEASVIAAKTAQDSLIASQRAWVGPTDASIESLDAFKPLKMKVSYGNSGRQPAPTVAFMVPKVYSIEDWNNGSAAGDISKFKTECLNTPMTDESSRVSFPTNGFNSFFLHYNGTQASLRDVQQLSVTPEIISGKSVVAFKGCFVYRTVEVVHRTAYCHFYYAKVSDPTHLNFCAVGQAAD